MTKKVGSPNAVFRFLVYWLAIDPTGFNKPAIISLLVANFIPILGVLFFSWETFPILLVFWTENLIVFVFTVVKIVSLPAKKPSEVLQKFAHVPYLCLSFGIFTVLHGLAIFGIYSFYYQVDFPDIGTMTGLFVRYQLVWASVAFFISHGISYVTNYLKKREYNKMTFDHLVYEPFLRLFAMQFIVLLGGFIIVGFGSIFSLVPLVLFKIYLDIIAHQKYHDKIDNMKPVDVLPV